MLNKGGVSNFDTAFAQARQAGQFYAFDMLAGDGEDHRRLALLLRKANLARLLSRPVKGISIAEYEQGDIGPGLVPRCLQHGLEGIVSKRLECAYGAGQCRHWLKVKEPSASGVQQRQRRHHWEP